MSWSYSGDPGSSLRDKLRFLIQDTVTTAQQFTDEELDAVLEDFPSPYVAASSLVRSLIARYSSQADKSIGDLSISYSQLVSNYRDLLFQLASQSALSSAATPYAGGISIGDKKSQVSDTDRVAPAFSIGMHNSRKD